MATGFTLFMAWVPLALWAHGHREPAALFMGCGGATVSLVVPVLAAVYLHAREHEQASTVVGFGLGLLVACAFGCVLYFGWQDSDQQALHDRGIAMTGVVAEQWESTTPDGTTSGVFVRLPDGTTHKLQGEQSPVGTQVVMTVDPVHHVDNRLGPPPGAPDHVALKLSVAAVALGCVASSACCAGLLTRDIRRWLRAGELADRRPAPRGDQRHERAGS
ncbi:hypothetical protein [Streptomyces sp. NPDC014006]|uniref:hypothetical protein n=1 Tax=Streptomyces sp. NPDC014006 TaxID=3364870 RepID=UPI0036FEC779